MKRWLLCPLFFSVLAFADDEAWLQHVLSRTDIEDAKQWLKQELQAIKNRDLPQTQVILDNFLSKKKCLSGEFFAENDPNILIFISFSVPETVWRSLSHEAEKRGAIFVINGLPDNSFLRLANTLKTFREKGIRTQIQLHPLLFEKYHIEAVPAFVVTEGETFDKLVGNVSLDYALQQIAKQGETTRGKP